MQKIDLMVKGTLVPMVNENIISDGALAIHDGIIIACGKSSELLSRYQASTVLESEGSAIMPGFINGHTHVGMTLLRGVADNAKNLQEWLNDYIFPLEKKFLSEDFVYWSTLLACYEMVQSGITTFADMYFFEAAASKAVAHAGIRALLGETIFLQDDISYAQEFCALPKESALITSALAPHSLYSCDAQTLVKAYAVAQSLDVPFIIHVAEQNQEVVQLQKKTGMSPAEYMQSLNILSCRVIIAHGVHFSDSDLEIIGKSGASIVYNPTSNMKLASGIAHVKSMQEHGIAVGLGTDGSASNNSLDSFAEMKTGALLQSLCLPDYCKPLTPFEVVKLATADGARAIKMGSSIGTLEVGKRADIIMVRYDNLHQLPGYDLFSQFVYSSKSTDVQTVIIDGKIVMHNRKMITLFDKMPQLRERIAFYHDKIKKS
jgi:5-methylthioadenosine/S-adenosylhomocysteine deaminase